MYAKLFASLYQGTLRGCSDEILVFTNMLATADATGVVDKHWRAISEETGLSRERVEAAIKNLEAPDPESRSPEHEGRRIILTDAHRAWGWRIVNYAKYRAIRNEEDRREQNRIAQERFRNKSKPRKPESAQAEAEAEAEERKSKTYVADAPPALPDWLDAKVWDDFKKHRGKKFTALSQRKAINELEKLRQLGNDPTEVMNRSIANGWKGLFANKGQSNGHTGYTNTRDQERADTIANLTGRSKKPAGRAPLSTDDGFVWEQIR